MSKFNAEIRRLSSKHMYSKSNFSHRQSDQSFLCVSLTIVWATRNSRSASTNHEITVFTGDVGSGAFDSSACALGVRSIVRFLLRAGPLLGRCGKFASFIETLLQ